MTWIPVDLTLRTSPQALPEQMDQPCSYKDLQACLRDISRVNRLTLAHRPTLAWLDLLVASKKIPAATLHIVDVGCGYGDTLRRIHTWAKHRGIAVRLTGIDLNADAIRAAREVTSASQQIEWIHGDAFSYGATEKVDVVISSLLTHHLEEPQIVRFLRWMQSTARLGWFINDLHRMKTPYHAFRLLRMVLPLHRFVQSDGLVSIRRSFLPEDWRRLCLAADIPSDDLTIQAYRPARLCVSLVKV